MLFDSKAEDCQRVVIPDHMTRKYPLDICPVEIPQVWVFRNVEVIVPVNKIISGRPQERNDDNGEYPEQW